MLLKPHQQYLVTVEKGDVVSDQLDPVGEQGGVGVVHHAWMIMNGVMVMIMRRRRRRRMMVVFVTMM